MNPAGMKAATTALIRNDTWVVSESEVAERVVTAYLVAAEEDAPTVAQSEINREFVICHDCGGVPKSRCDLVGHGMTTLGDLIDTYSNG